MTPPLPSHRPRLRSLLRWLALGVLVLTVGLWAAKGAHRGWTQDRVAIPKVDEITGIEYSEFEKRFVPGLDWLAGGSAVAAFLFAVSFCFRSHTTRSHP